MKTISNIFVIDDDQTFVFLAMRTIEKSSCPTKIDVFKDGLEALDYLKCIPEKSDLLPDIIFLDLNMPVMDGWAFLDEYMQLQFLTDKKIQIYITSSTISPHDIERAKEFSVVSDVIIKPLRTDKVDELLLNLN